MTFAEIANKLQLANGSAARRRIETDLVAFLAGPVDRYRAEILEVNQELRAIIDAEPSPGFPTLGSDMPDPITAEFVETLRQEAETDTASHDAP